MAKWYGNIGFAESVETEPGVWIDQIKEVPYYGEILNNKYNLNPYNVTTTDVVISRTISITSDPYAEQNFPSMRYVVLRGTKVKITVIDDTQYPRLLLTLGGLYNGE